MLCCVDAVVALLVPVQLACCAVLVLPPPVAAARARLALGSDFLTPLDLGNPLARDFARERREERREDVVAVAFQAEDWECRRDSSSAAPAAPAGAADEESPCAATVGFFLDGCFRLLCFVFALGLAAFPPPRPVAATAV